MHGVPWVKRANIDPMPRSRETLLSSRTKATIAISRKKFCRLFLLRIRFGFICFSEIEIQLSVSFRLIKI